MPVVGRAVDHYMDIRPLHQLPEIVEFRGLGIFLGKLGQMPRIHIAKRDDFSNLGRVGKVIGTHSTAPNQRHADTIVRRQRFGHGRLGPRRPRHPRRERRPGGHDTATAQESAPRNMKRVHVLCLATESPFRKKASSPRDAKGASTSWVKSLRPTGLP